MSSKREHPLTTDCIRKAIRKLKSEPPIKKSKNEGKWNHKEETDFVRCVNKVRAERIELLPFTYDKVRQLMFRHGFRKRSNCSYARRWQKLLKAGRVSLDLKDNEIEQPRDQHMRSVNWWEENSQEGFEDESSSSSNEDEEDEVPEKYYDDKEASFPNRASYKGGCLVICNKKHKHRPWGRKCTKTVKHGSGIYTDEYKCIYKGMFSNNELVEGEYIKPNGDTFQGSFKRMRICNGKWTKHFGDVFEGTFGWGNTPLDGTMTFNQPNQNKWLSYKGGFDRETRFHSRADNPSILEFENRTIIGHFINGKLVTQREVVIQSKTGWHYRGLTTSLPQCHFHGKGVYDSPTIHFCGTFDSNKPVSGDVRWHETVQLSYPSKQQNGRASESRCTYGSEYTGEVNENYLPHGFGCVRFLDGCTCTGTFENGKLLS